jgi:hypothetical protein
VNRRALIVTGVKPLADHGETLFRPVAISAKIAPMPRQQKITLGEMRESGPTRLLVYCGDYKCAHSVVGDASH